MCSEACSNVVLASLLLRDVTCSVFFWSNKEVGVRKKKTKKSCRHKHLRRKATLRPAKSVKKICKPRIAPIPEEPKDSAPCSAENSPTESGAANDVAERPAKWVRVTASTNGPEDPEVVRYLLNLLWSFAGCDYEPNLGLHEQRYSSFRLNIYWTRDHVGIHDKLKKKDVVSFTSETATISTHLALANMVARS